MKKFMTGMLCGIVLTISLVVFADETFYKGKKVFVKAVEAKLLDVPDGKPIATVARGTSLVVVQASDRWVAVVASGYVPKDAVTGEQGALRGEAFRAYMILVASVADAQAILGELQGGADFQTVARQKSTAPNKTSGGDLGDAYPGDLSPEFEKIILALKAGETSGVVKTSLGYQIFKRIR